jgi:hypothetical protein
MAESSGALQFGLGVVNGIGELSGSLNARVNKDLSLFAEASVDTQENWQALTGLKFKW